MERRDEVTAIAGRGLEGDRYCEGTGSYSARPGTGRQVTLVESEAVRGAASEAAIDIEAGDTRRNIVTEDVPLNHLVGRRFRIGGAVLEGKRLCEPCVHLEELTVPGARQALVHRGGLRADIVSGGLIRVGDEVTPG